MPADEYDALIDDPTGFLYNVWLPRVSTEVSKIGSPREITQDSDPKAKERLSNGASRPPLATTSPP